MYAVYYINPESQFNLYCTLNHSYCLCCCFWLIKILNKQFIVFFFSFSLSIFSSLLDAPTKKKKKMLKNKLFATVSLFTKSSCLSFSCPTLFHLNTIFSEFKTNQLMLFSSWSSVNFLSVDNH